ncbi:MAG: SCO6880 family protein [Dermatophilaceae bacterium]
MSDTLHSGWRRERFGPFAGLSGLQAGAVLIAWLPALTAVGRSRWDTAIPLAVLALLLTGLIVVPIRRRPAIRWLTDAALFLTARAAGWSAFRARVLEHGTSADLAQPDLPGTLAALRFHNGPPVGDCVCVCVIHNPVAGLWAATARLTHPGLGNADSATRDGYAAALGGMLAAAAATEEIARISIQVRTIPDDGAARAAWVADHTSPTSPPAVVAATEALETVMRSTAVRQELFVTVAVAETRIRRAAKEAGGGIGGRARVLARHLGETEQALRGLGATDVAWLPTQEVAAAIRCGYNPAEAVTIQRCREEAARGRPTVAGPPLGACGPVHAPAASPRRYVHDGFTSVCYAVLLPELPTRVGSLTRMLAVTAPGERRTLTLHYEPIPLRRAGRQVEHDMWAAEISHDLRAKRGFRISRRERRRAGETAAHEHQLAAGHTMVRVAAAASLTVASERDVEDHAASFEASARASGYTLLRLDLAQDSGFVAAALPVGVGLTDKENRA